MVLYPAQGPHHGGVYERMVGVAKRALDSLCHYSDLTVDEFRTMASYFWLPCRSKDVLCLSISLSAMDRNGTERHGTENQTTQLCLNDQLFTQYVFVCMIVNGLK